jgi:phosphatidylethanolamine/phosphatidyl-N-methylethanolamine N-methyltransferase
MDNQPSWYESEYNKVNASAMPGSVSSKILHRFLEQGQSHNYYPNVLEIGSNNGEHLPFVKHKFDTYYATDLKISTELIKKQEIFSGLKAQVADVQNLPFETETFDRVLATCVFHHLADPSKAFRECLRVTKQGGIITIIIPNDPGIAYRAARRMTTVRNAQKRGLRAEVDLLHALEHLNHFLSLISISKSVFENQRMKIQSFPMSGLSHHFNLISKLTIQKNSTPV